MSSTFEKTVNVVITTAAVVVAVSVAYRTFGPMRAGQGDTVTAEPDKIEGWEEVLAFANPIGGDPTAPVKLIIVTDLECPVCATFHRTVNEVLKRRSADLNVLYVSFPLPNHRFAEPAARVADCADHRGAFRPMIDAIYDKQDSLGLRPWTAFAKDAGIQDTLFIARCALATDPVDRIARGRRFGERIRLAGTPTVIINGWRYPYPPTVQDVDNAIDAVLDGREPRGEARTVAERERASK